MEEGKKKKKEPLILDWEKLLPIKDEESPPVLVVMESEQASQSDIIEQFSDHELNDAIRRNKHSYENFANRLPDKGDKLRTKLKSLEDELERRKLCRLQKDADECEKPTKFQKSRFFVESNGFSRKAPSSQAHSQSTFASHFVQKMEEKSDSKAIEAFDKEFSDLGHRDSQKMHVNGQFSQKGRRKIMSSSRQSPFRCPSSKFLDKDNHKFPNGDQKGCASSSTLGHPEDNFPSCSSKKRDVSQILPSIDSRARKTQRGRGDRRFTHSIFSKVRALGVVTLEELAAEAVENSRIERVDVVRKGYEAHLDVCKVDDEIVLNQLIESTGIMKQGQTVVLVDEEDCQSTETAQQEDEPTGWMKEAKIYYPSRNDPESVELCYSDIKCLAPEAFLSSTIMNFYIRYLQRPVSPTDRPRGDYHIFNTYFYKKLKEAVSYKKSDKETFFIKFRRWWKGVNIFHKAYILLPIHEDLHWSLVIICIPDKKDESGPIILHLDSLGYHSSSQIFGNMKRFLKEEWNYLNQGVAPPDLPIADRIWKNLPRRIDEKIIMVPQQKNDYDCGLFVLFFMERFFKEAPERLRKKDLVMFGKQWFRPEEASGLRERIQKLLNEEFQKARVNCSRESLPLSSGDAPVESSEHHSDS
ncbi:hypothetical protein HHK36_024370 [Tetracentron sinense]|uniref:Ubiquitin-like protease family profile domain-containing protein n=1 Tax=Tetracentron sinense TaxID=13715 RepID=A0A835D423_TETSI|nr:hypothetical protein HHK36_024370 [Tetracentron sinense]